MDSDLRKICKEILRSFNPYFSAWEMNPSGGDGEDLYRRFQEAVKVKRGKVVHKFAGMNSGHMKQKIIIYTCPDYSCCALCGMFSCDCGPGSPCHREAKDCMAHPRKKIKFGDYGKSITISMTKLRSGGKG